eukprot:1161624-Pelagomonas_calceolata.AAC.3
MSRQRFGSMGLGSQPKGTRPCIEVQPPIPHHGHGSCCRQCSRGLSLQKDRDQWVWGHGLNQGTWLCMEMQSNINLMEVPYSTAAAAAQPRSPTSPSVLPSCHIITILGHHVGQHRLYRSNEALDEKAITQRKGSPACCPWAHVASSVGLLIARGGGATRCAQALGEWGRSADSSELECWLRVRSGPACEVQAIGF